MELVIAEKPSVAQSIAAVLGATQRKDGYLEGKPFKMSELEQEENRRFQNGTLFPVYHGSAKNNLGIRQLIEVIASKFYSSTPEGLNYAGRFLRLNIQRKGGVLFMCVYIAEHCI